jgi:hypothetical protein
MSPFSGGGPSSGLLGGALGGIMMPLMILVALRKAPPGPVKRLMQAGAVSPDTALKPSTAKITRPVELNGAKRKGIVIALPDGRCWVDVRRFRRRRVVGAVILVISIAIAIEIAWLAARALGVL